jgi:orotate phosphoribosyltransferase
MYKFQQDFIEFALECNVLQFGEVELKSGMISDYFFNFGMFNTGSKLSKLGEFYTIMLVKEYSNVDMIFGPAYKGIPLVSSVSITYSMLIRDIPFAFNRIEEKNHGEGGIIIGAPLNGNILILDDVITAGTAINKSINIINNNSTNATVVGALVAIDRRENITETTIPIHSIINIHDIKNYMIDHELSFS